MTGDSDDDVNAWLADVREKLSHKKSENQASSEVVLRFFRDGVAASAAQQDEPKSAILDSPERESLYQVNYLTKKSDGTTVVHYYFPSDAAEANGISHNDALFRPDCAPLNEERARNLAREVMREIVSESGARIEFQEVSSLDKADLAFVKASGVIEHGGGRAEGYAGHSGSLNYVVDGMSASNFRQVMQQSFNLLPPEEREKARKSILEEYGDRYGKDADIFAILASEREKMVIAHEIEHALGAKHPDAATDEQLAKQTIMGDPVLASRQGVSKGSILGSVDVEWYQNHFAIKTLPEGTLPAPSQERFAVEAPQRKR